MLVTNLKRPINDSLAINEDFYINRADGKTLITDIKTNISVWINYNGLERRTTWSAAAGKYQGSSRKQTQLDEVSHLIGAKLFGQ